MANVMTQTAKIEKGILFIIGTALFEMSKDNPIKAEKMNPK